MSGAPSARRDGPPHPQRDWSRITFLSVAALALFVLAWLPRTLALDQHATADEDLTLIRSANVALALERGDWWGTYQIGHPEATVQLLVALGLGPERLRPYAGEFLGADARTSARVPGYFETLVAARNLLSPVHAGLIVLAAVLCWRLWGGMVSVVAGLLLALEPFLVAHGRILRTDALLSELMLVAVLAALAFWSGKAGWWSLVVCALATGLAWLTKTPALALIGAVPAAALAGMAARTALPPAPKQSPVPVRGREGETTPADLAPLRAGDAVGDSGIRRSRGDVGEADSRAQHGPSFVEADSRAQHGPSFVEADSRAAQRGWRGRGDERIPWWDVEVSRFVLGLLAWLGGSLLVAYATWPALWARPLRAIERMAVYTQEKGGSPMDAGSFFLGSPIADPGPLYYAVALPLRLSPLVLIGLLLWTVLRAPAVWRGVGAVLLIGIGLAVVLAFLPKKADRYILPAIPFLILVAAVGIAELPRRLPALRPAGAVAWVLAGELVLLTMVWPYPLAAYNPLLGGGPAAAEQISVGWGEGLDQLAPILNARPDAEFLTVSTPYPEVLQAQIRGRVVDLDAFDVAEYAVRYVAASQRHLGSPALDVVLAHREPLERVEIAGVPYAELYALDPASFAGNIEARNLEVTPGVIGRRGWVTISVALGPASAEGRRSNFGLTPFVTPLEVEAVLLNSADPTDVEAAVTRSLLTDGSRAELKLRAPNSLGRFIVGLSIREPAGGAPFAVTSWPIGAPRLPDRLVFPSLSVRVQ